MPTQRLDIAEANAEANYETLRAGWSLAAGCRNWSRAAYGLRGLGGIRLACGADGGQGIVSALFRRQIEARGSEGFGGGDMPDTGLSDVDSEELHDRRCR